MKTWIAFFRGINVGGNNILPMKELVRELEKLGFETAKTYIQSGNAVFQSPRESAETLAEEIGRAVEASHGFMPRVLVLSVDQLADAIASNPFPEGEAEPKTLHLQFLASAPTAPDLDTLRQVQSSTERFHLTDKVFYLHAPDGIGRSKLVTKVEKCLGVPGTARNWRTVQKVWELAKPPSTI